MPKCGSQIILCDLPIRFDTYKGCTHFCKYCFARKKQDLSEIGFDESVESLRNFIKGKRGGQTNWCDWDIPIHWGGMSDPFQPCEKTYKRSLDCLKLLAETQYPFVVSTKGKLIADGEYLELIKKCNCVVQISMAGSSYDKLEEGAPSFEERLEMARVIGPYKRVIARVQPYFVECHNEIIQNVDRMAECGVYGIVAEAMKFEKKITGLVKVGGDLTYPLETLRPLFIELRDKVHSCGMKFYSGENRLRQLGDSLCCCGIDGLEGFKGNDYNLNHLMNGIKIQATEKMKEKGTADCFKALYQDAGTSKALKNESFTSMMMYELFRNPEKIKTIFGK